MLGFMARAFALMGFAVAVGMAVILALGQPNVASADGHCPYGEAMPENPLSSDCWATPAELGDVVIEFRITPVLSFDNNRVCRQDHRLDFTGEWAQGDLIRPVIVKAQRGRLRLPWEQRHQLVGIREYPDWPLTEWHYTDAARVAEEMRYPHMDVPTKWFVYDRVETGVGVAQRSPHGWVVGDQHRTFDWPAALRLCAQVHAWANHVESRGIYIQEAGTKIERLRALRERLAASQLAIRGRQSDGEREYLAFGQWLDIQSIGLKRMERVLALTLKSKAEDEERIRAAGFDPATLIRRAP